MTRSSGRVPTRARLASLMDQRRRELRLTWDQVASRAGIHRETLRQIRTGTGRIRPLSAAGLEDALQWTTGSIDEALTGGDPTPIESTSAADARGDLTMEEKLNIALEQLHAITEGDSGRTGDELTLSEKVDKALEELADLAEQVKELRERDRQVSESRARDRDLDVG